MLDGTVYKGFASVSSFLNVFLRWSRLEKSVSRERNSRNWG